MASHRIAGIDFGTVRIGIALADERLGIASPYENFTRQGDVQDAEHFRRLAREEAIERFVIGLPVHLDGRESQRSAEARRFGEWLSTATGVQVVYFDERFTSVEALQHLEQAGLTKKKRKERLDKLAAQIMLTAYLESANRSSESPGGLGD